MALDRNLLLDRDKKKEKRGAGDPGRLADEEVHRWIGAFRDARAVRNHDERDAAFATEYLSRRRDAHVRVFEFAGVASGLMVALIAIAVAAQVWIAVIVCTVLAIVVLLYVGAASRRVQLVDRQLDRILDVTTRLPKAPRPSVQLRVPIQHVRLGRWSLIRFEK